MHNTNYMITIIHDPNWVENIIWWWNSKQTLIVCIMEAKIDVKI